MANSPRALVGCFAGTLLVSSVVYALAEDADVFDSLYWSIVTATTLGYGDFSPHSAAGKILTSALICLMVLIFIPTITANLASKLIVDRDAFTHEEQEQIKRGIVDLQRTTLMLLERLDGEGGAPAPPPVGEGD